MPQASAFAAEQLRELLDESAPHFLKAKTFAAVNRRSLPDIMGVNGLVKVWWEAVVVVPAWDSLPFERRKAMEDMFLDKISTHEGITPQVMDYALMCAFFHAFAENPAKALPAHRAEPIRGFPTQPNQVGSVLSYERLSGVDVAPFLRGRVFAALTKAGRIAKADLLTLTTLIDELEQGGTAAVADGPHAINIEPASLLHANDFALLEQQVRRLPTHLTPRLCIEVTERGREDKRLKTIFQNLALVAQATGCLVAYDDYRGLEHEDEHLLILQPHSVKIDGALIRPALVEPEPSSDAFAEGKEAIAALTRRIASHAPDAKIIGEWAETPAAYQALAALGVDGLQSYVMENKAKANPSLWHLAPDVLAQRETALANLASTRESAKQTLPERMAALQAMEQAKQALLAHELAA